MGQEDLGAFKVLWKRRSQMRVLKHAQVFRFCCIGGPNLCRADHKVRTAQAATSKKFVIYGRGSDVSVLHQVRLPYVASTLLKHDEVEMLKREKKGARKGRYSQSGEASARMSGLIFLGRDRMMKRALQAKSDIFSWGSRAATEERLRDIFGSQGVLSPATIKGCVPRQARSSPGQ